MKKDNIIKIVVIAVIIVIIVFAVCFDLYRVHKKDINEEDDINIQIKEGYEYFISMLTIQFIKDSQTHLTEVNLFEQATKDILTGEAPNMIIDYVLNKKFPRYHATLFTYSALLNMIYGDLMTGVISQNMYKGLFNPTKLTNTIFNAAHDLFNYDPKTIEDKDKDFMKAFKKTARAIKRKIINRNFNITLQDYAPLEKYRDIIKINTYRIKYAI